MIVQFGFPRSGSTRVYNALKSCLPQENIVKAHSYRDEFKGQLCIATFRPAKEMLASYFRVRSGRYTTPFSEVTAQELYDSYGNIIPHAKKIADRAICSWIPYSARNYYILGIIEGLTGKNLTEGTIEKALKAWSCNLASGKRRVFAASRYFSSCSMDRI